MSLVEIKPRTLKDVTAETEQEIVDALNAGATVIMVISGGYSDEGIAYFAGRIRERHSGFYVIPGRRDPNSDDLKIKLYKVQA